jgi:sugar phosphate isomerase/epimerase
MSLKTRREVLQAGAATLASLSFGGVAFGQKNPVASKSAPTQRPAAKPAPAEPVKFSMDAYSRNLQWCRTPEELAKVIMDLGQKSVDLSVGDAEAHVSADQVKSALPDFAKQLEAGGVTVRCITTPIVDADSANVEAILAAASSCGIGYYNWGGLAYEAGKPMPVQVESLKRRVGKLVRLNEKYRIKGLYQPAQGLVGSSFFDFLPVLQTFDPKYVAFRYDTAALLQPVQKNVELQLTLGAPYIGGVALNDARVTLDLPVWKQGAFDGDPKQLLAPSGGGDNTGDAGGTALAYGGGGNPLPYHFHPVPTGTGMIDLILIGKTLKDIGFNGPTEVQVAYPLGGAETGAQKITLPRQQVIGRIERDRITVEHAFAKPWGIDVVLPPFMKPGGAKPARPAGPDGNL